MSVFSYHFNLDFLQIATNTKTFCFTSIYGYFSAETARQAQLVFFARPRYTSVCVTLGIQMMSGSHTFIFLRLICDQNWQQDRTITAMYDNTIEAAGARRLYCSSVALG